MKTIELLAPAGDQESLIAAIQNGANAIYLGGSLFNARAFAKNFDHEQLKWAISYAHLRDVKIYVTVNTLYKDEEFHDLIEYIDYLYDIQVDALIIQDIGLFHIIKTRYQDFDIHMSTQASIMNSRGVSYFEQVGASRVVLARENTLEEIQSICQSTSLEVEVFVHGALCVCYSGQCLMSSFIGGRSGNRGACAQPCRLQYRLLQDNQFLETKYPFLLSPKDLMTVQNIGDLIDAGVTSFKIEGRMKRPEYVASVVKAYRKAIDAYLHNKNIDLENDIANMKAMFNRNYTLGYAFSDNHLVDGDYPGHKGQVIGEAIRYHKGNKRVAIKLFETLNQEDSIVFEKIDKGRPVNKIFLNNQLVSHANKNDIIEIEFDHPVYEGNVRKTVDKNILHLMKKTYQDENTSLPIDIIFEAKINQCASLKICYKDITVEKKSLIVVEKAQKTALDKDRIIQQLSKLGQSPFYANTININTDEQMTMPIKEINALRRECVDELMHLLSINTIHHYPKLDLPKIKKINAHQNKQLYVAVSSLEQLEALLETDIQVIYYLYQSNIEEAYTLCVKHKKELGLYIPSVCKDIEIKDIMNHSLYAKISKMIVNDYGCMNTFNDKELILGTGLNIYNSYSASYYDCHKILSLEMSQQQINHMNTNLNQNIIQVYGKVENMVSDYCPISQHFFGYQKKHCQLCKKSRFSLVDRKNETFDLMMDEQCRMHLLNCKTLFIDKLDKLNVGGIFLRFTNEEFKMTKDITEDFISMLNNKMTSQMKTKLDITLGYFRR